MLVILIFAGLAVGGYWFWPGPGPGDGDPTVEIDQPSPATPDPPDPDVDLPVQGISEAPDTWVGMTVGGGGVPEGILDEDSRAVLRAVPAFIVVDAANLTPGAGV